MSVTLNRVDPGKNMARFYKVDVQPSLFGDWTLIREWGRMGQGGTVRYDEYATEAEARSACEVQVALKRRRGYQYGDLLFRTL